MEQPHCPCEGPENRTEEGLEEYMSQRMEGCATKVSSRQDIALHS